MKQREANVKCSSHFYTLRKPPPMRLHPGFENLRLTVWSGAESQQTEHLSREFSFSSYRQPPVPPPAGDLRKPNAHF